MPELLAEVVGESESIEGVSSEFRSRLANELDVISSATHGTFKIDRCLRGMDWEPYQIERRLQPAQKLDPLYPPYPDLQQEFFETVQRIIAVNPEKYVLRAIHYFRLGVIETDPSDQFLRFWTALEVIAEGSKEVERIPLRCPKCANDLFCAECEETPTRRPMATQAIRQLLIQINAQGEALYKTLADTRNHLTHGGSHKSLETKIGMPLSHATNNAAAAAWHAILYSLPTSVRGGPFGHHGGDFVHRDLLFTADMLFEHRGDGPHPTDDNIPKPQISVKFSLRPNSAEPKNGVKDNT
ncbi:MAG TPA: methylamine utilization protein MauJ [Xanthobacteraceae bacterium]